MISLVLAIALPLHQASTDAALELCKPVLARKAGGEISTIAISSSAVNSKGRTIRGQLTAFLGMGPPAPGAASTHHLIRADFTYRCRIQDGRVRKAAVNPLKT